MATPSKNCAFDVSKLHSVVQEELDKMKRELESSLARSVAGLVLKAVKAELVTGVEAIQKSIGENNSSKDPGITIRLLKGPQLIGNQPRMWWRSHQSTRT